VVWLSIAHLADVEPPVLMQKGTVISARAEWVVLVPIRSQEGLQCGVLMSFYNAVGVALEQLVPCHGSQLAGLLTDCHEGSSGATGAACAEPTAWATLCASKCY